MQARTPNLSYHFFIHTYFNMGRKNKGKDKEERRKEKQAEKAAAAVAADDEEVNEGDDNQSNDIKVEKFTVRIGGQTLFKDADLTLAWKRRYGLIGLNGCGKTTLMKAIARREGDFARIPKHFDILLLEQEVEASDEKSALQTVIEADKELTRLRARKAAIESLETDAEKDEHGAELAKVFERMAEIGADSADQRASAILTGLQFPEEQKHWPTKNFSGGWRMRISLARALFRRPRLLLLDEPTNHLDLHAVIWLETYLRKYPHTLMIVSHDRDFLDFVCTDTIHCFQKKLVRYNGGYNTFAKVFEQRLVDYKKEYEKQQKKIKQMKKEGKLGNVKNTTQNSSKSKKKQKEALASKKDDIMGTGDGEGEVLLEPIKENKMKIEFKFAGANSGALVRVENVDFGYPGRDTLFEGVDFGLHTESKIGMVGPNGTGKSTLLKLMDGELEPTKGDCNIDRRCRIGVFSQHSVDQLEVSMTPVEYIQSKFPDLNYQDIRNRLGRFGLPGDLAVQKIQTLSGGQKARVAFVELGMKPCHILLLDEPTNHLDLETIDCLIAGLQNYDGGVVVITHNTRLISEICNEVWVIGLDKTVTTYDGSIEDYRDELEQEYMDEQEAEEH
eukprot:TRINITY_DN4145_c0_g2_i2.p1 TRINITY_DN4145_c0_g2~~TRINITY_DN4145_c0_g2_i2.p1  ORF type:complete len:616 (-),score=199.52 TRINITY_DN4145_c0_g2_i2:371-2218(-)